MARGPARPQASWKRVAESARRCVVLPWEVLRDTCRLLRQNPQLMKVTLAAGLQMGAADIAPAFDMGPDVYNDRDHEGGGAAWIAIFSLLESCVALLTAPAFGRFTDLVDRRIAYLVFGLLSCLPTWVYWFFPDLNAEQALLANQIASVFAATGTTSHVGFALAMDVTPFEDRELAAGAFFGLKHFIAMLLAPFPCLIFINYNVGGLKEFILNHPKECLLYQLVVTVLFIICVFQVKPEKQGCEDRQGEPAVTNKATEASDASAKDFMCLGVTMLRLMCTDQRLKRLCLAGFVLSFCRAVALGNNGQYCYQVLGLGKTGQFVEVNVLRNFAHHTAHLPGALLTGYVAMKAGTLKTLRRLIPVTGLLLAMGVALEFVRTISFTIVIEFTLGITGLYTVPLDRLVAGVARPGRTGSWLNMLGSANCMGSMLGNLVIICLNLSYWHIDGKALPLWVYYPTAGLLAFLALLPLLPNKPGPAMGWGAAAGLPEDMLVTTFGVARFAGIWKNKTIGRSKNLGQNQSEESSSDESVFGGLARRLGLSRRHITGPVQHSSQRSMGSSSSEDRELSFLASVSRHFCPGISRCTSHYSSGSSSNGSVCRSESENGLESARESASEIDEGGQEDEEDPPAEEARGNETAHRIQLIERSTSIRSVQEPSPTETEDGRAHSPLTSVQVSPILPTQLVAPPSHRPQFCIVQDFATAGTRRSMQVA